MLNDPSSVLAGIARFNRRCRLIAAAWLFMVLPISFLVRPTYQDFSAYYLAGSAVRMHRWDLVYPQRPPGSVYFIYSNYRWKPEQLALARQLGIKELLPFFGLPWNACIFVPFTWFDFETAHALWIGVLLLSTFGVALLAGRSYELAAGRPSRMAGAMTLVAAMSALSYRSVRVGNVSAPTALALGALIFSLLRQNRRSDVVGAGAFLIGGLLKYATIALIPLLLATRRWRLLLAAFIGQLLIVIATLAVAGRGPFEDFLATVATSFNGSTPLPANQSVWGMLLRVTGRAPLPAGLIVTVRIVQGAVLGWLILPIFRGRVFTGASRMRVFRGPRLLPITRLSAGPHPSRFLYPRSSAPIRGLLNSLYRGWARMIADKKSPAESDPSLPKQTANPPTFLFAGSAGLICWMLIFSPVFWEHYAMYLMPMWGWLAWEATTPWKKCVVFAAIALAWCPLPALLWLHLLEPFNSMMLASCCLILVLAIHRLRAEALS